jgi:hypothetical protein
MQLPYLFPALLLSMTASPVSVMLLMMPSPFSNNVSICSLLQKQVGNSQWP